MEVVSIGCELSEYKCFCISRCSFVVSRLIYFVFSMFSYFPIVIIFFLYDVHLFLDVHLLAVIQHLVAKYKIYRIKITDYKIN